jgi:hypothetical protein
MRLKTQIECDILLMAFYMLLRYGKYDENSFGKAIKETISLDRKTGSNACVVGGG